jgi:dihydroneopterin triphosphate diphosphatase
MPKIVSDYLELYVYSRIDRKYLLLKRAPNASLHPGIWQTITATTEKNESTKEALMRELAEETGLKDARIFVVPRINSYYMVPLDVISLSPVFLAITKNAKVTISDEHDKFKWVSYKKAIKLIHWEDQEESLRLIKSYLDDKQLFGRLVEIKV